MFRQLNCRLLSFRKVVSKKGSTETSQSRVQVLFSQDCFHQLLHEVTSQNFCGGHWTVLTGSDQVNSAIPNLLQKQCWTPRPLGSSISTVLSTGSSVWLPTQELPSLKWEHFQQWHAALTSQILGRRHLSIPTRTERQGMYRIVRTQTLLPFCRFKLSTYYFYLQIPPISCP